MSHRESQPQHGLTRRQLLTDGMRILGARAFTRTTIAAGAAYTFDKGPTHVLELFPPYHSSVALNREHRTMLKQSNTKHLWIIFGGATVGSAEGFVPLLEPVLDGPIGAVTYARGGVDMKGVASELKSLQHQYGINKVSVYGHSLGVHVAAGVLALLGDRLTLRHVMMDCSPLDTKHTVYAKSDDVISKADVIFDNSAIITALGNTAVYKTPIKSHTASPGLLSDQGRVLRDGEYYIRLLANRVASDKSHVSYLTPIDATKDPINNSHASLTHIRRLIPSMQPWYLGGNQGHANLPENTTEYHRVLVQALAAKSS